MVLYIYAAIKTEILEDEEEEHIRQGEEAYANKMSSNSPKSDRFAELKAHLESNNPNDWKLAIIEADIILDKALKDKGYAGPTIGDMLKSVAPSSLQSLQDAWEAHLVRNKIAHDGASFHHFKNLPVGGGEAVPENQIQPAAQRGSAGGLDLVVADAGARTA